MKGNEGAANKKELSAIAKLPKPYINEFMPIELQRQYFFGGLHRLMKELAPEKQNLLLETLITINKGNEFEQIALHERRNTK